MTDKITIKDLDDGRQQVAALNEQIQECITEMSLCPWDNQRWQAICDRKYELIKARREVRNLMGRMVKERHNAA